ncbi:MAG TPA: ABC transporter ATP-binding protein [Acetobacteraceae bacterium]|nr:ABC transporter ATP-binding protein [Acetobacteraceae bacterium]
MNINLDDVVCKFGDLRALDQISMSIAAGEFLVVLGPSGCGKTTLLRVLAGFHRPQSGTVRLGADVVAGTGRFVAPEDRNIGIVFQSYALWPHMSVAGNVGFALERRGLNRMERQRAVTQALRQVGLEDYATHRPGEMSGGQRQRVALARAAWRNRPASCCWTNRSRISIRHYAAPSRTSSLPCTRGFVPHLFTLPTTRTRRWRWPTASP